MDGTETRSTTSSKTSFKSFLRTHCPISPKPKNPPYQQTLSQMSFANSQISTMTSTSSLTLRWRCSAHFSRVTQASKSRLKSSSSSSLSARRTARASPQIRASRQNSRRRHRTPVINIGYLRMQYSGVMADVAEK